MEIIKATKPSGPGTLLLKNEYRGYNREKYVRLVLKKTFRRNYKLETTLNIYTRHKKLVLYARSSDDRNKLLQ